MRRPMTPTVPVLRRVDRNAYPSRQVAHHRSLHARDRARRECRQARRRREADLHGRGRSRTRQGDAGRTASRTARRACAPMSRSIRGIGMRGFEGVQALVDEYKWAIDIELCVFPQEGLTNNPGTEELMVEGLKRGARVIGAAPGLRHRSCRPDPPRVRTRARIRRRYRHASRLRQHAGRSRRARWSATSPSNTNSAAASRSATPPSSRPGAGRGRSRSPSASPMRASRSRSCRRPTCS